MLAVTGGEPFLAARGPHTGCNVRKDSKEGNSLKTQ